MKVLVTGGAGFIGRRTVERLVRQGDSVVVVDCAQMSKLPKWGDSVIFYQLDIASEKLEYVMAAEKPDYVIHLAAQTSVRRSLHDPFGDAGSNIMGTINLLKQCVSFQVKKIVFSSSAAVYGTPRTVPIQEEHQTEPLSFYGISKLMAERYIQSFAIHYGLDFTILRYANVYGIREYRTGEDGVITAFIERLVSGLPLIIYGDGRQTRDFIHVEDVAAANVSALLCGTREIINISSGTGITLLEVAGILKELYGKSIAMQFHLPQNGDIEHSILCNGKSCDLLGLRPVYSLYEGLQAMLDYEAGLGVPHISAI